MPAMSFDLGLEEVGPRMDTPIQHHAERFSRKQFESARHVCLSRPEQQIGQRGSTPTDEAAGQEAVSEAAAFMKEPASKNAIQSPFHGIEELWDVAGLMAESSINFQNPVTSSRKRFLVAAHIGVHHALVFRSPHYFQ